MSRRDKNIIETYLGTLLTQLDEGMALQTSWSVDTVPETKVETKLAPSIDEALRLKIAQRLLAQAAAVQTISEPTAPAQIEEQKTREADVSVRPESNATIEFKPKEAASQVPEAANYIRPDWARGGFQTLIFRLGPLRLAVPLVKLGGIHKIDRKITRLVGRAPWFMGLLNAPHGKIAVIDTAMWIIPERYEEACQQGLEYDHVILLDDTHWGLASTGIEKAKTFHADEVKWSDKRKKRPWMAGMLKDEMCALIDVDVLIDMLNDADNASENGKS